MSSRYTEFQQSVRARWLPRWNENIALSELSGQFQRLFAVGNKQQEKQKEIWSSGKFSKRGAEEEVRASAKRELVPALRAAQEAVDRVRAAILAKRATLSLPKAAPGDAASAVLRGEMRAWLRSMGRGEALGVLMATDVDEQLLIAALETPAAMMGPLAEARPQLEGHILQRRHGQALAVIEEEEEAAGLVAAALEITRYQLKQDAGFPEGDESAFNRWLDAA